MNYQIVASAELDDMAIVAGGMTSLHRSMFDALKVLEEIQKSQRDARVFYADLGRKLIAIRQATRRDGTPVFPEGTWYAWLDRYKVDKRTWHKAKCEAEGRGGRKKKEPNRNPNNVCAVRSSFLDSGRVHEPVFAGDTGDMVAGGGGDRAAGVGISVLDMVDPYGPEPGWKERDSETARQRDRVGMGDRGDGVKGAAGPQLKLAEVYQKAEAVRVEVQTLSGRFMELALAGDAKGLAGLEAMRDAGRAA